MMLSEDILDEFSSPESQKRSWGIFAGAFLLSLFFAFLGYLGVHWVIGLSDIGDIPSAPRSFDFFAMLLVLHAKYTVFIAGITLLVHALFYKFIFTAFFSKNYLLAVLTSLSWCFLLGLSTSLWNTFYKGYEAGAQLLIIKVIYYFFLGITVGFGYSFIFKQKKWWLFILLWLVVFLVEASVWSYHIILLVE